MSTDTAEGRRDAAFDLLAATRAHHLRLIQRGLAVLLIERDVITPDDLRDFIHIPDDINPVLVGAVFAHFSRAGLATLTSYRRSRRPESHARPVGVWQATSREALSGWLDRNPPLPMAPESCDGMLPFVESVA